MRTIHKRLLSWLLFTVAHVALTVLSFWSYVDYAMKVDHGLVTPTLAGEISQYFKSIVFLPILLPFLRLHVDPAFAQLMPAALLLNSMLWVWGGWWLWRRISRR